MVVLGGVVLICFVELSFIFVIYILFLKKSGCAVFLECSAPSCDIDETRQVRRARGVGGGICSAPLAALFHAVGMPRAELRVLSVSSSCAVDRAQ